MSYGAVLVWFGGVHVASGESWWVLVGSGEFWVQFWCVLVWFLWVLVSSGGFWKVLGGSGGFWWGYCGFC